MTVVYPEQLLTNFEDKLNKEFPLGLVPRTELPRLTGGILNAKTVRNKDWKGEGIDDPVKVGGKTCYMINNIIDYLRWQIRTREQQEQLKD